MNPFFISGMAGARRAMRRHQDVPPRSALPLWKLLLGELVYLLREVGKPRRLVPALLAGTLIGVGLSPWTPGPVAAPALRVLLAVVAAGLGMWAGTRLPVSSGRPGYGGDSFGVSDAGRRQPPVGGWRGAVSGIGAVVFFGFVAVAAGWLLAVLIAAIY